MNIPNPGPMPRRDPAELHDMAARLEREGLPEVAEAVKQSLTVQPTTNMSYRTYLYTTDNPINGHFEDMPEISGGKCVGINAGNLFDENEEAMSLIAKIVAGHIHDPRSAALVFLTKRGYGETYPCLIKP